MRLKKGKKCKIYFTYTREKYARIRARGILSQGVKMEKDIERYLVREVKKMGGQCLKWVSPGSDGVPDRIILLPGGHIWFVELKDDRGRLSALQKYWLEVLYDLGFMAVVVKGMDQARLLISVLRDTYGGSCDAV